jgi:hypothetical protein
MAIKRTRQTPASSRVGAAAAPLAMSAADAAAMIRSAKSQAAALARPSAELARFTLTKTPARLRRPARVRPRRLPHMIVEGNESTIFSATPRVALAGPAEPLVQPLAATSRIALARDTELAQAAARRTASNVDEPSCAINGDVVLYTGNWYAAVSRDGGATFRFMNPTQFDTPRFQFCCDQVAHYIPSIDTFVWLLQYGPSAGNNVQRLAFARTADAAAGRWRLFDVTTQMLGVPGAFLDFPDLAVGANALYVTTNIFLGNGGGSAVVRLPFSGIASGQITAQRFVFNRFSLRVAQNCGTTAHFATHETTSSLRVFSWRESAARPTSRVVPVTRWLGGNGYQSRTPDGRRWLDRADPRITGATLAGGHLWFAWTVNRGSNQRPKPFIQIARIRVSDLTTVENINVFDPDSATAYPALATNANDEVGIAYVIGGGPRFPTLAVGILTGTRADQLAAASDRGPEFSDDGKGEWGDYVTVRRCFPNQKLFAATGYTMKGAGDGTNRDATPRFVVFGRSSDVS